MSEREHKIDTILTTISVMAGDAKNVLTMADQTQEAAELHPSIGAAIRVGIEYLHQIEQLADSLDAPV